MAAELGGELGSVVLELRGEGDGRCQRQQQRRTERRSPGWGPLVTIQGQFQSSEREATGEVWFYWSVVGVCGCVCECVCVCVCVVWRGL